MNKPLPENEQDGLHGSKSDLQLSMEERLQDWLQESLSYIAANTAKKIHQNMHLFAVLWNSQAAK